MVHLWCLKRIQKTCLSAETCRSVSPIRATQWSPTDKSILKRVRACLTHPVEALAEAIVTAHPAPLRVPCFEIIRVDYQHPNRGDGSSSSNRSTKASEKLFVKSILVENWEKIMDTSSTPIGVTVWDRASRYQRHISGKGFPPSFPPSRFSLSLIYLVIALWSNTGTSCCHAC